MGTYNYTVNPNYYIRNGLNFKFDDISKLFAPNSPYGYMPNMDTPNFKAFTPQSTSTPPPNTSKGFNWNTAGKVAGYANAGIQALNAFNTASNDVGNAFSAVGGIVGSIPTPYTAVAGAILSGVGAIANGFTNTVNEQHEANIGKQLTQLAQTTSNATNYNELMADYDNFFQKDVELGDISSWGSKGIFSSGSRRRRARAKAVEAKEVAKMQALNNLNQQGRYINQSNMLDMYTNLTAYGGPLNKRHTEVPLPFGNRFDAGGLLNTDFTNGITKINEGGTHEANPFEGVQVGVDPQGIPNLVEEGEVIWNDYVFSNRLEVPDDFKTKHKIKSKGNISFADAAKKLSEESKERPNDPISKRGLNANMTELMIAQEMIREKDTKPFNNKFYGGGPFNSYGYVKDYNGGWFDGSGNYTQEYLNRVNALTIPQLQSQLDEQYSFYTNAANKNSDRWKAINNFYTANPKYNKNDYVVTNEDLVAAKRLAQDGKPGYMHYIVNQATTPPAPTPASLNRYYIRVPKEGGGYTFEEMSAPYEGIDAVTGMTWAEANPNLIAANKGKGTVRSVVDVNGVPTTYTDYYYDRKAEPSKSKPEDTKITIPLDLKQTASRYAPVIGAGIGVFTDALGITNKPDYSNAEAIEQAYNIQTPTIGFTPIGDYIKKRQFDRNYYLNQLRGTSAATQRAIMNQSSGNIGATTMGLLANTYNTLENEGKLARQAEEFAMQEELQRQTFNRDTNKFNSEGRFRADAANQQAALTTARMRAEGAQQAAALRSAEDARSAASRTANLTNFLQGLGDIGNENEQRNWLKTLYASGYFGYSPSMERTLYKDEDVIANFKRNNPKATIDEIASATGISTKKVKKYIEKKSRKK